LGTQPEQYHQEGNQGVTEWAVRGHCGGGVVTMLLALRLVGKKYVVYGANYGCHAGREATMEENLKNILAYEGLIEDEKGYRPQRQSRVCRGREENERDGEWRITMPIDREDYNRSVWQLSAQSAT
jgi:hypothetical protein